MENNLERIKRAANEHRELVTVVHSNYGINEYYIVKRIIGDRVESFYVMVTNINGVINEYMVPEEDMPKISSK